MSSWYLPIFRYLKSSTYRRSMISSCDAFDSVYLSGIPLLLSNVAHLIVVPLLHSRMLCGRNEDKYSSHNASPSSFLAPMACNSSWLEALCGFISRLFSGFHTVALRWCGLYERFGYGFPSRLKSNFLLLWFRLFSLPRSAIFHFDFFLLVLLVGFVQFL